MGPVRLVVNPTAGGGRARRLVSSAEAALRGLGIDYRTVLTEDGAHPIRVAREATVEGAPAVVALGGDGLVGSVAEGLVGSDTALAIVPAGSGNDFAASLGLPRRRPFESLACLREGRLRRVDAVRVQGPGWERHFVCVGGAGIDTEVVAYANTVRRLRGTTRYVWSVLRTLVLFQTPVLTVRVDGRERRGPGMMVAVANAPRYGGGMWICPGAEVDDGVLDVCVVEAVSKLRFAVLFPRVFWGRHVTHPAVTLLRGSRVEVEASRAFDVNGDGEQLGPLPATFTVVPRALLVAAP